MPRFKETERHQALPARIRLWLLDNPGEHRAMDIAKGIGLPTQKVANALGRLARDGAVKRRKVSVEGRRLPITYYRLP